MMDQTPLTGRRTLRSIVGKCRSMSPEEWRVRGAQAVRKYAERWFGLDQGELSDRAFRGMLPPSLRSKSQEHIVRDVRETLTRTALMPGSHDRDATIQVMAGRFRQDRTALIDRADRAIKGRFDLLGYPDLSFGEPIDWCREPLSDKRTSLDHWTRIPYLDGRAVGDKKIVWELNRHAHFVTLGQAYWLTGDERYAEAVAHQLTSWMDANPPRRGINWASSLEAAVRSIAWVWALHFVADSPRLSSSVLWRVLKHVLQHGAYIESYLSHYFAPNTHLTGEGLGLFYLGTAFAFLRPADRWRSVGLDILSSQLEKQVRSDGVYFEQSSYYHRYTADFYLHLILRSQAAGLQLPPIVRQKVVGLLDHLLWITRPDGLSTMYGDDDGGRLLSLGQRASADFRDTLQLGAALFSRGDWKWAAGPATVELLWLLGPEGLEAYDRLDAECPGAQVRYFESSGQAVLRDGWQPDATYVFFDCGVHGAVNCVHAHADALSIEFASDGVTWIVDPGTYTYTKDPGLRDYFRTSQAHNTVSINGMSQAMPTGPFSWSHAPDATLRRLETADGRVLAEADHNGYARMSPPVRHARACELLKQERIPRNASYLVLRDTIWTSGVTVAQVRFHLSSDCRVSRDGLAIRVSHVSGKELLLAAWCLTSDGTTAAVPFISTVGWVSPCYGQLQPADILTVEHKAVGKYTLTTVLVPCRPGEEIDVNALNLSNQESPLVSSIY